ncbi:MAG: Crp/Fnr family transcriptional regulator [Gammaproteobacteria bacterium]|nr:Crp/Fnr family transcriptional regulator [Gammaproteobacteria bacterium]
MTDINPSLSLKIAERKVLSDVFPEVKSMPELNDYAWNKQVFKKNDVLFRPLKPCNRFMLLGSGCIRIELQNTLTRSITLYRIEPGQLCIHSLINLINDEDYSYIATAEENGWFCWADKAQFNTWMLTLSSFQHWIFNNIGARFKQVVNRFAEHSFVSIDNRLANFLIEKMNSEQMVVVTQADIASELGTAREIISRHLSKWQKMDLIKKQKGGIEVLNIDELLVISS